ncbi:MAG TPA: hypothetical protein VFC78_10140 [Tepidisphaeraceae bacterium]|nr:hypothetical protein [Tepidisphaeraceae bacterium]
MPEEISILGELAYLLDQRPFHPFVIVMSSGERYEVTGKHQVAIGESVVVLIPPRSNSIHLRSTQISSIEEREPRAHAS